MRIIRPQRWKKKKEKKAKPIPEKTLANMAKSAEKQIQKAAKKRSLPKTSSKFTGWEYKDRYSYRKQT